MNKENPHVIPVRCNSVCEPKLLDTGSKRFALQVKQSGSYDRNVDTTPAYMLG
jgi:hypothetical protein